jgi:hypothetical protein
MIVDQNDVRGPDFDIEPDICEPKASTVIHFTYARGKIEYYCGCCIVSSGQPGWLRAS